MNKIIIKGRLTADPELKTTQNGTSVCTFSVAVTRRYNKDETDFFNCEAWRGMGEFISNFFTKGQEILICGEMHFDKYQKNGENRTSAKLVVDEVEFCGGKTPQGTKNSETKQTENTGKIEKLEEIDGDLPF